MSGGRGVWVRNDLERRLKRLLRLERTVQDTTFVVSEEQLRLLDRHSLEPLRETRGGSLTAPRR